MTSYHSNEGNRYTVTRNDGVSMKMPKPLQTVTEPHNGLEWRPDAKKANRYTVTRNKLRVSLVESLYRYAKNTRVYFRAFQGAGETRVSSARNGITVSFSRMHTPFVTVMRPCNSL